MEAPAFDESDFERVKQQTLNYLERGRRYNRDEELSKELLYWMAYRGTPYEHPEEGYVESVRSITLDDVRAFYDRYYVRDNIDCDGTSSEVEIAVENGVITELKYLD